MQARCSRSRWPWRRRAGSSIGDSCRAAAARPRRGEGLGHDRQPAVRARPRPCTRARSGRQPGCADMGRLGLGARRVRVPRVRAAAADRAGGPPVLGLGPGRLHRARVDPERDRGCAAGRARVGRPGGEAQDAVADAGRGAARRRAARAAGPRGGAGAVLRAGAGGDRPVLRHAGRPRACPRVARRSRSWASPACGRSRTGSRTRAHGRVGRSWWAWSRPGRPSRCMPTCRSTGSSPRAWCRRSTGCCGG